MMSSPMVTEIDGMNAVTLGRTSASRQVLAFMGFLACVEPFEVQRFKLLAALWDAEVTVVDAPGCGYGSARLTSPERKGLRRGDFAEVTARMVRAALLQHPALKANPVTLAGYSMGASIASATTTLGLVEAERVVLVEPVAIRRRSLAGLIHATRSEDRQLEDYLQRNSQIVDAVRPVAERDVSAPHTSRRDLAHLAFALGRGRLPRDLLCGIRRHPFELQLVHGSDSRLSRSSDVSRLAARCRRAGIDTVDLVVDGGHALWHSLPDVTHLAERTMSHWTR